ncbi:MAG TPA: hypothetical protein VIO94_12110, partial [Phenylobacterium sp.]
MGDLGPAPLRQARAEAMVRPTRPGLGEDAALVAAEVARLPLAILDTLFAKGVRVVACRDNVTDHARHLVNDHPRNWPPGQTWAQVPGVYLPGPKEVVVATIAPNGQPRRVPRTGEMHGSRNLAVHESMHGYDYVHDRGASAAKDFRSAQAADRDRLGSDYFTNPTAGAEETFAESAAIFFCTDEPPARPWPTLCSFWEHSTFAAPGKPKRHGLFGAAAPARFLGTAEVDHDGALQLDLRAEGEGGEVGHALITYAPDHPDYERVRGNLTPGRARGGFGVAAG